MRLEIAGIRLPRESYKKEVKKVGSLVKGQVVAIEKDSVVIDIGYKSEGRVSIKEFTPPDKKPELGDEVEVFFENAFQKIISLQTNQISITKT